MTEPRWQDPRVRRRAERALRFAGACLHPSKGRAWSTRWIDHWFGQAQNPVSQWLRQHLLIVTDDSYNRLTGQCKQYRLNQANYVNLRAVLGLAANDQPDIQDWATQTWQRELSTGEFQYQDKSHRLWHPLQNLRKAHKRLVLSSHGLQHEYDIKSAAVSLIYQHAQAQPEPMDVIPEHVWDYLQARDHHRRRLAQELACEPDKIKVLITALLSGARLGANPEFAIFRLMDHDPAKIEWLRQDPWITGLRADMRLMWSYISQTLPRRTIMTQRGHERLLPITSRQKWARYFELERQVLDAVRGFMTENQIPFFAEHDGWTCAAHIDPAELAAHVRDRTGFVIDLDYRCLEHNNYTHIA